MDPMGDGAGNPYDQKGKGRAHQNGDVLALDLTSAEEGGGSRTSNGFMQMQLIEQQVTSLFPYIDWQSNFFPIGFLYPTTVNSNRIH